jgi:hypothetical protein
MPSQIIIQCKHCNCTHDYNPNEVYAKSRYPGGFGLLPEGMPSEEQIKEFVEFAKEMKALIMRELA